jgi:hypothetical protein
MAIPCTIPQYNIEDSLALAEFVSAVTHNQKNAFFNISFGEGLREIRHLAVTLYIFRAPNPGRARR